MNWYGRQPLRMRCPHCGTYGPHETKHTLPKLYRWTDRTTSLFERLNGTDISFREREKRCSHCGRTFRTIEAAKEYLASLIAEVERLTAAEERLKNRLSDVTLERDEIRRGLETAASELSALAKRDAMDFVLAELARGSAAESRASATSSPAVDEA